MAEEIAELIDLEALSLWMDRQGLPTGTIEKTELLGGGTQNILLKFSRGGETFVLRRPPPHPRPESNNTIRREARLLSAIAGSDVPHPGLIAACGDEDILGVAFYLMQPIDGFNPTTGLAPFHLEHPEARYRMGFAMAEGIAKLGAIDYIDAGLADFGKPENYLDRQVARWQKLLESYSDFAKWPGPASIPGIEKVANWLNDNRPASFKPGIIHGDFHLSNVMFCYDSAELAAIVDWELTTIGDPLLDLGWLMATWPDAHASAEVVSVQPWKDFATIDELIRHYGTLTVRDMSAIQWYGVLACYKLGIILEGTFARACEGLAPVATGDRLHASTVGLFERALRMI
ncbi:MAG: phosphotransferase family protein [Pseudomonadales bacterium]|nr:phosphotransferase family protein [Pseudomonadales bacterium]